ncbi:MAG: Asp23/Gls24 family envelope stress response protein [Hamadaea sp.]|uniref:Asp23/Gls24 family envelope stress response protein n=1 Tax=Hamadaea sp. TaxID=2024425 RepID=UPI0018135B7A|nr:Asp23/Gls24 family envelope stress response protein [Hamadaea sp.]NUR71357.1 Asp23/Gls24 family envelope stress response protein [Hamadaea sp.]NUT23512.1 Asp23/Gls24 family envelope stress response protein [Hamadaea sp.]
MSENTEAPATVVATAPVQPSSTMENFKAGANEFADQAEAKFAVAADAVSDAADRAVDATRTAFDNAARRIRNNAELAADRGKTHIRHEVVEKIAGIAAREVPGVYDLGGDVARMFSAVKERIGLGDADADQGVKVTLEGRTAQIDVTIVIEFGYVVHSVTDTVRVKVINSVENLLGLEVTGVDVIVDDVHVADDGPVGDDESRAADYVA